MITDKIKDWMDNERKNFLFFYNGKVKLEGKNWSELGLEGFHTFIESDNIITIYVTVPKNIIFNIEINNSNGQYELILREEEKIKLKNNKKCNYNNDFYYYPKKG